MGSWLHGVTTYRCYDDCRQEGCPKHTISLYSKHGTYYIVDEEGNRREISNDLGTIDAVVEILNAEKVMK